MSLPVFKQLRLSNSVENIANFNEVQNNVLKVPNGICYKKFDEMRRNKQLCDIKIVANNGEEIWAHKVVLAANSEYFNVMFNSQFKESYESEIKMQVLNPDVLSLLIDFFYSSVLAVNEQNAQEVLYGIYLLQLDEAICNICVDYIKTKVSPINCFGMEDMAEDLGLKDLLLFCYNYTLIYYGEAFKNEEFLLITFDQLFQYVRSEDLCVHEEKVYESVMKWIKHDREDRDKHLLTLMKFVQITIISKEYFESNIKQEPLLKFNDKYKKYLDEASYIHSVTGAEFEATSIIRYQCRKKYSEYVLIMSRSGKFHLPLLYNIDKDQWKTIPINIPLNIHGVTHLLNDGRLFDLGGVHNANILDYERSNNSHFYDMPFLNSCHIYDPKTKQWKPMKNMLNSRQKCHIVQINDYIFVVDTINSEYYNIRLDKWKEMNSMNTFRIDYAVIVLDGLIYAIGGCANRHEVKCVEQFDPNTNTWKSVAPMLHGRSAPALSVLNNCIYAIGGKQFPDKYLSLVEKYDPSTDSWEEVPRLNNSRSDAGAVTANGLIYVFGGQNSNSTIEVYCPFSKKWSELSSKVPNSIDFNGSYNAIIVKQYTQSKVLELTE